MDFARNLSEKIFSITSVSEFNETALKIFSLQYANNAVYNEYCRLLDKSPDNITHVEEIPFLPIEFFKTKKILTGKFKPVMVFRSSGTTNTGHSLHQIADIKLYERSFIQSFTIFYGQPSEYRILALLPSFSDKPESSLVYMTKVLIEKSSHPENGFFLHDHKELIKRLKQNENRGIRTLLFGVSYALLDLAEIYRLDLHNTVTMETGGMKGQRPEITRQELHAILCERFGIHVIHSEYGMTELLSQAYSQGKGIFKCPPWMRVTTRQVNDPLSAEEIGKTGGVNVIDLANIYSCSFIATQDLGRYYQDGSFEILGRYDNSQVRGCNLLVEQ